MSQRIGVKNAKVWLAAGLASVLVACATMSSGGGASGPSADAARWPTRGDVQPSQDFTSVGLAALDARMKEAVDKGEVAGLEYVLIKDGKVAAYNIFGNQSVGGPPMTEDTIFRIRSMTKPITGVAMMQLYEQGKWKPEDPVTKFLPELGNLKVATNQDSISEGLVPANRPPIMNEVMTHTAGFGYGLSAASAVDREFQRDNPHAQPNLKAAMNRLKDIPLLFQPGERWSYSYAVDVQAAALEKMTGMTFGDYLDKNVFTPLGMEDTGFFVSEADYKNRMATVYTRNAQSGQREVFPDGYSFTVPNHHESGGGGLTSTTHDYARFVQMLINDGTLDGKQILKPETVKLMMTNHIGDKRSMGGGGFGWGGAVKTTEPTDRAPAPIGTFDWFGIDGTWFWADPVNNIGFVGMIQRRGNAGPGAINLRGESQQLVYKALNTK
ncbi:MAG TPA: serine hydrolase [Hyphomonadaceae bacterium]|nr:serine hydrolase [Hyphomonadaceae bacterium]